LIIILFKARWMAGERGIDRVKKSVKVAYERNGNLLDQLKTKTPLPFRGKRGFRYHRQKARYIEI
jgi:hypothetical protein